jgi:acyl-CoA thioester hydrolase
MIPNLPPDLTKFKHHHTVTVRNYEIDWQVIVHNVNYLLYFEIARVEYFKAIGMAIDQRSITGPVRIVIVRNELDHFATATFDDRLTIMTRVTNVGNSSFRCEAVMMNEATGIMVSRNAAILVWTDPATGASTTVPDDIRTLVRSYEGEDATILVPENRVNRMDQQ